MLRMSAAALVVSSLYCGMSVIVSPCAMSCTIARRAAKAEAGISTSFPVGSDELRDWPLPLRGDPGELLAQRDQLVLLGRVGTQPPKGAAHGRGANRRTGLLAWRPRRKDGCLGQVPPPSLPPVLAAGCGHSSRAHAIESSSRTMRTPSSLALSSR